jgi:hypothetical protein
VLNQNGAPKLRKAIHDRVEPLADVVLKFGYWPTHCYSVGMTQFKSCLDEHVLRTTSGKASGANNSIFCFPLNEIDFRLQLEV